LIVDFGSSYGEVGLYSMLLMGGVNMFYCSPHIAH